MRGEGMIALEFLVQTNNLPSVLATKKYACQPWKHRLNNYIDSEAFFCFSLKMTCGNTLRDFFDFQLTLLCLLFS
jgi:hypothetical protein